MSHARASPVDAVDEGVVRFERRRGHDPRPRGTPSSSRRGVIHWIMARTLLDLFFRLGSRAYDWMYRRGAPWESGPRSALVELCESGRVNVDALRPGRAIDLGCGTGADSIYLASRGFSVTGVDYSTVAIARAGDAAAEAGVSPRFEIADLLTLPSDAVPGPFDFLFDGGTIDDFPQRVRPKVARAVTALARPGAVFVMWCFYGRRSELPLLLTSGPSRWGAPPIEPGELEALFGDDWEIERYESTQTSRNSACFVLTRL